MRGIEAMQRPDHPDFWAISRTLIAHDEVADAGGFIAQLNLGMNEELLMDLALLKGTNGVKALDDQDGPMLKFMTLWLMGFTDGVQCARGDDTTLEREDYQGPDLLGIDGASLTYAAHQRAIRAMMETDFTVAAAAASWLDGFTTGIEFDRYRGK